MAKKREPTTSKIYQWKKHVHWTEVVAYVIATTPRKTDKEVKDLLWEVFGIKMENIVRDEDFPQFRENCLYRFALHRISKAKGEGLWHHRLKLWSAILNRK